MNWIPAFAGMTKDMRILMFSTDRTLLGDSGYGGDAPARHAAYGKYVESLDIVVFAGRKYKRNKIADNVWAVPTDSCCKLAYVLDAFKQGEAILKSKKIDLIAAQDPHFTGFVAMGLSKKYKIPFTVNVHGDFFGSKHWRREQLRNRFLYYLGKFIARQADGARVTSEAIKKSLLSVIPAFEPESRDNAKKNGILNSAGWRIQDDIQKIQVIPTPVDLKKFQRFDFAEVNRIKEKYQDKQIVLFVGRLVKAKDIPVLLRAIKEILIKSPCPPFPKGELLPTSPFGKGGLRGILDFVLLIIGKGEEEKELKSLKDSLGLQDAVDFIGRIDYDALPNYYRACNFLVLPSNNESFGKVLLEVAMAEKPAVVTDTAGAKEIIIDKKNGLVSPIGDINELAKNILEFLQNKDLVEKMGKENFKMISEKFGYEKNVGKIIEFWKKTSWKVN